MQNVFRPLGPGKFYKGDMQWKAGRINSETFYDYFYRLEEFAINMFEWSGLPDTVDERFLEVTLCEYGFAVYFRDEVVGDMALTVMLGGPLDVYRIPTVRRAYSVVSTFKRDLGPDNSVLIFNNRLFTSTMHTIMVYARQLYEIQRAIDVNVKAQKTPTVILTSEKQHLSWKNMMKNYDGNETLIFATPNMDMKSVDTLTPDTKFIANDLYTLKKQTWAEALAFFGIQSNVSDKKERLVTDEVAANLGQIAAQRYVMLNARREAAKKINKMFGTNIEVNFRQDFEAVNLDMATTNDMHLDREVLDDGEIYD